MKDTKIKDKKRLVLADYFLAFSTREISGNADVWRLYTHDGTFNPLGSNVGNVQISGDLYATPDIKDICSTYYPLIGPYDTQDEDVAEYHVLLAKAAGVDGFLGEWAYQGMSRDLALLNLARVGAKYNFPVGANWCEYGHFTWQNFKDRRESIEAAKKGFIHLLKNIYGPCGVKVDQRELVLLFDARPEKADSPKQAFFGPDDIGELREAAQRAGFNPLILTRNISGEMLGTVDGFFAWMPVGGSTVPDDQHWTMVADRERQVRYLKDFYTKAEQFKAEDKIDIYLGGIWQGFDDHKGQAWGSGEKRYIPRDNGVMLQTTWRELLASPAEIALIVSWNDWEEATHIEPSLELGYRDLEECARQISDWKGTTPKPELLRLPERLYRLRKQLRFFHRVGFRQEELQVFSQTLDQAASAISEGEAVASEKLLQTATEYAAGLELRVRAERITLFWEFSLPPLGVEPILEKNLIKLEVDRIAGISLNCESPEFNCNVSESIREKLQHGHFIGRLSFEYLDSGTDFIRVLVDHEKETHRLIADFRKKDTGKWAKASLDLVNTRFVKGLPGGIDFIIRQQQGTRGGIRMVRIDGSIYNVQ